MNEYKMSSTQFRDTTFNPSQSQQYQYKGGPGSYKNPDGPSMEEKLAIEMARMKMEREK